MRSSVEKLLSAAGPALSTSPVVLGEELLRFDGSPVGELVELLSKRNGFYALESALHVFPSDSACDSIGLDRWNSFGLWRSAYGEMADDCLFFAEDVFGGQFCISGEAICSFDPETGGIEQIADSIDAWAKAILSDYEVMTGYPLAHAWQKLQGCCRQASVWYPRCRLSLGVSIGWITCA